MQPVLWIIDGNNFLHGDPQLSALRRKHGIEAARAVLESELLRFRARKGRGHSILLAYDGAPPTQGGKRGARGLRIVYPRPGEDADRICVEEARRAEGRSRVRVVSSDRKDVVRRLRGLRVESLSAAEFGRELWPTGPALQERADAVEKPPPPRGAEIDHWLEQFSEGDPESPQDF